MSEKKNSSFVKGAVILVIANLIVKVIGAVFKIPLANLIQEDGMGLFNTSYTIYTFMFVVATAGFPTAVAKMVAESTARGNEREANRIFKVSVLLLGVLGIIGTGGLYFFAEELAGFLKNSRAALSIMAISPAVLCVALVSAFRGYFQGQENMMPTAASEVIEAFGKLFIGYSLAYIFLPQSVEKASAGAVFGVASGSFLALVLLVLIYAFQNGKKKLSQNTPIRSKRAIAKELLFISIPVMIGASVASLTNVVDMLTVMRRLQSITAVTPEFVAKYSSLIESTSYTGAVTEEIANKLYGLYTGYAVPLFNLPLTIVVALAMSIIPAIAGANASGNRKAAQETTSSSIKITVLFALPCTVGLAVLAEPVLYFIYENSLAGGLLRTLAFAVIFVSLLQITNAILQAYGKMNIPVINMFIGGVIKVIINYFLVALPGVNISGAPIGTLVCYFSIVLMNMYHIIKITGCRFEIKNIIVKPLFAAVCMGIAAWGIMSAINLLSLSGMMYRLSVVPAIGIAALIYLVMIFATGCFTDDEIRMLPMGEKLLKICKRKA